MILVVGATGNLGSDICRRLVAQQQSVRALVRCQSDQARIDALEKLGVDVIYGDLKHPSSLVPACEGIRTVISTATSLACHSPEDTIEAVDQQGQLNLVTAARRMRVHQFIYVSYSCHLDAGDDPSPLTIAKRTVEDCLRGNGGMIYTILRPCCLIENVFSPAQGFDYHNAKARIYGPGSKKVTFISLRDVSQFAVLAVENPAAYNATLELGGPEALSPLDVVHIFEDVSGRPFEIEYMSMEALQARRAHTGNPLQKSIDAMRLSSALGYTVEPVQRDLRFKMTTVRDFAERVLV